MNLLKIKYINYKQRQNKMLKRNLWNISVKYLWILNSLLLFQKIQRSIYILLIIQLTLNKFEWLVKHLAWNASKPKGNFFWVKVTEEESKLLTEKYPLVTTRTLKGGVVVNVVQIFDNNIVLDIR